MHQQRLVAVISGGSEIGAVALVEELLASGFQPLVIALRRDSLFRGMRSRLPYKVLTWPPENLESCAMELVSVLRERGATQNQPAPVFATEDGGLRLLLEMRDYIEPWGVFGQARLLRLGGIDKAELFLALDRAGCAKLISPYRVVTTIDEAIMQVKALGGDAVIKPSLKPFSMRLEGMAAKAFMSRDFGDTESLRHALGSAWRLSRQWIVQQRLEVPTQGETVVWSVRDGSGRTQSLMAHEVWKQPIHGGTACWVRLADGSHELLNQARALLDALEFVGICEIPFLLDEDGHWRMLELNPRPWLQIGLPFRAGVPMAAAAARILCGEPAGSLPRAARCSWVNVERLLLATVSGDQGPRLKALQQAWHARRLSKAVAIHDSPLAGVRSRWLARLFRQVIGQSIRQAGRRLLP